MGTSFGGFLRDKINEEHNYEAARDSVASGGHLDVDLERLKKGRIDAMKSQNKTLIDSKTNTEKVEGQSQGNVKFFKKKHVPKWQSGLKVKAKGSSESEESEDEQKSRRRGEGAQNREVRKDRSKSKDSLERYVDKNELY